MRVLIGILCSCLCWFHLSGAEVEQKKKTRRLIFERSPYLYLTKEQIDPSKFKEPVAPCLFPSFELARPCDDSFFYKAKRNNIILFQEPWEILKELVSEQPEGSMLQIDWDQLDFLLMRIVPEERLDSFKESQEWTRLAIHKIFKWVRIDPIASQFGRRKWQRVRSERKEIASFAPTQLNAFFHIDVGGGILLGLESLGSSDFLSVLEFSKYHSLFAAYFLLAGVVGRQAVLLRHDQNLDRAFLFHMARGFKPEIPLAHVFTIMVPEYPVDIRGPELVLARSFTGGFLHVTKPVQEWSGKKRAKANAKEKDFDSIHLPPIHPRN